MTNVQLYILIAVPVLVALFQTTSLVLYINAKVDGATGNLGARIDEVQKQLDRIDARLERIEDRLTKVESLLAVHEYRLNNERQPTAQAR